jgi:flagellar motility protein MotE (MotC chaperone)
VNARFLPGLVFVTCVLVGFGVGLEADGQSTDKTPWTTPDWQLPWGMTWPEVPVLPSGDDDAKDPATTDAEVSTDDSASTEVGSASTEVGPGGAAGPGDFPGLVNPPGPDSPDGVGPESAAGAKPSAEALSAQLTQLDELETQLRSMAEASQAARAAVEGALAGRAREAPLEPGTPEEIQASLVLLADMVKKMKPSKAAELLQQWSDKLAIGILRRLGSRRATPILSKMPVEVSGRLTSLIAAGIGALPPATAADAKAPPQGEEK